MANRKVEHHRNIKYDVLRAIAMFSVMLYHYSQRYNEVIGHTNDNFIIITNHIATIAVSVFLIMVGFFSYKELCKKQKISQYLKKRAARLLPTFWVSLIVITIILIATGQNITIWQFITNFFLINKFVGIDFIDGAHWYMTIMISYLVFSAIYIMANNKKNGGQRLIMIYVCIFLLAGIINSTIMNIPASVSFICFSYINKAIIGLQLAKLISKVEQNNKYTITSILVLAFSEILFVEIDIYVCDIIALLIIMSVSVMPDYEIKNSIISKAIIYLSTSSYFIYLFHQKVGFKIIELLENNRLSPTLSITITVVLIVIIAAIYNYFDKKLLKIIAKRNGKKQI